jgi:hypothetical protein
MRLVYIVEFHLTSKTIFDKALVESDIIGFAAGYELKGISIVLNNV